MDYASIKDKDLASECLNCGRRVLLLGGYWDGLAVQCEGDVSRMEAALRCGKCGGACRLEVSEPQPARRLSPEDHAVLMELGAAMRAGRKAKKRSEG